MNYDFENLHPEGKPLIIAHFADESYEILNGFLLSEVRSHKKAIFRHLREGTDFSGNSYAFQINGDQITLTKTLGEEASCILTITELTTLISDYLHALRQAQGKR